MSGRGPLAVDIISDVVCPWCFIGKRRLEQAIRLRPDAPVAVNWRPFQLDPTIPRGGIARGEYLARKFGGPERIGAIYRHISEVGAGEGIAFRFDLIERSPNTLDAHRLIHWAKAGGMQDAVVERLFQRYFLDGDDIGDVAVLGAVAAETGMDARTITDELATPADVAAVTSDIAAGIRIGVQGVPFFVFDGRFAVAGAETAEVLVKAIDEARTG